MSPHANPVQFGATSPVDGETIVPRVLLTRHEIAAALGFSVRKIDALVKQRKLPAFKIGGAVRFRYDRCLAALDAYERVEGHRE